MPLVAGLMEEQKMIDRFIREKECKELTGLSRETRKRMESIGRFPIPYEISPGIKAYKESEIDEWFETRQREIGNE